MLFHSRQAYLAKLDFDLSLSFCLSHPGPEVHMNICGSFRNFQKYLWHQSFMKSWKKFWASLGNRQSQHNRAEHFLGRVCWVIMWELHNDGPAPHTQLLVFLTPSSWSCGGAVLFVFDAPTDSQTTWNQTIQHWKNLLLLGTGGQFLYNIWRKQKSENGLF